MSKLSYAFQKVILAFSSDGISDIPLAECGIEQIIESVKVTDFPDPSLKPSFLNICYILQDNIKLKKLDKDLHYYAAIGLQSELSDYITE